MYPKVDINWRESVEKFLQIVLSQIQMSLTRWESTSSDWSSTRQPANSAEKTTQLLSVAGREGEFYIRQKIFIYVHAAELDPQLEKKSSVVFTLKVFSAIATSHKHYACTCSWETFSTCITAWATFNETFFSFTLIRQNTERDHGWIMEMRVNFG